MSIFTIIKANLRNKKGNFIGVLFFMFLITFVATVSFSVSESSKKRAEQSLIESGVGDFWCNFSEGVLTDEMIQQVLDYEEVERAYVSRGVMISDKKAVTIAAGDVDIKDSLIFQTYDEENAPFPVYTKDMLDYVENPEPLKSGEIYLPVSFQKVYSCKEGDLVEVETETVKTTLEIKGFVEDMTLGNPVMIGLKNVWISNEDFAVLKAACDGEDALVSGQDNFLIFRKQDSSLTKKDFKKELDAKTGVISNSYMMISREEFVGYATMMTNIFSAVMVVFAVLLFAGALAILGHSISSNIEMDYVNLGVLKSQGFRKGELQAIYFCQYLLAGFIGEIIGFLVAFPAVHYVRGALIGMTGFLPEEKVAWEISLFVMILMLLLIFVFTLFKTGKIGKISPMRAISGGRESIYFSNRIKVPLSKNNMTFRLMLRQVFDNGKQYVSSMLIVAMLVYFIMATGSTLSCMDEEHMLKDYYGIEFDIVVDYKDSPELKDEVEQVMKEFGEIEECYPCASIYLTLEGDSIYVTAPESSEAFTNVFEGREPRYANEVVITEIIAEKYDFKIGDKVSLVYDKKSKEYLITGYYQSVQNTGKTLIMIKDGLEDFNIPKSAIAQYNYLVSDKEKVGEIVEKLHDEFGDKIGTTDIQGIRESMKTISDASVASTIMIYTVAILFILAAAYMVCDKVFLKEKNDYGIYKSQGFTTGNLRMQFSLRFFTVALAGGALGAVLNVLTNDKAMGIALRSMGITHFETDYAFMDYAAPVFVLALVFFFFSYVISGRIKKVDTKSLIVE